ncbi:MAG: hypothetical protein P1P67_02330 [Treponema phagedenis]|uniref:hypothetical protein n=1 Tax=Treponema phagedenis TaxID=162 RepID=UPI0031341DE8
MKTDDIVQWREFLVQLPDKQFFTLMRLYLGEIKTPFNKQRLIESLSAFFRKKQTKDIILTGLDPFDTLILSAVAKMNAPTRTSLTGFFSTSYSLSEIFNRLLNLEERLLIYRKETKETTEKIYKINPLLKDSIESLIDSSIFFLPEKNTATVTDKIAIDDLNLCGLYSFFLHEKNVLKVDGNFKKKTQTDLEAIFPGLTDNPEKLLFVCTALQNIGLFIRNGSTLTPQQERWKVFSQLSLFEKRLYILLAVKEKLKRDDLVAKANYFAQFLFSLHTDGLYKKGNLERAYYLSIQDAGYRPHIRKDDSSTEGFADAVSIISIAETLGFFCRQGDMLIVNSDIFSTHRKEKESREEAILIDPSFEATVLPETTMQFLLPILFCMKPLSIQTIGRFEITRKTCANCFEQGIMKEALIKLLEEKTNYRIPQNVMVSISDWHDNITSVRLYQGIVISVSKSKQIFFQKNEELQKLIAKKLADGVFLLHAIDLETVKQSFTNAGLEFLQEKTLQPQLYIPSSFSPLILPDQLNKKNTAYNNKDEWNKNFEKTQKEYNKILKELEKTVREKTFTKEEKKILKERIQEKIIINEKQINSEAVRTEKREVSGIDFLGKCRLIDAAISSRNPVKIEIDSANETKRIIGLPLFIDKTEDDVIVSIKTAQSDNLEKISVARSSKITLLQTSIFS